MTNRNIIAATVLGLFGGVALASESQIDYTDQHLTMTRAEVQAETRAFFDMHPDFLARSTDAYGHFDAFKSHGEAFGEIVADGNDTTGIEIGTEAYGGFPVVDDRLNRGE